MAQDVVVFAAPSYAIDYNGFLGSWSGDAMDIYSKGVGKKVCPHRSIGLIGVFHS